MAKRSGRKPSRSPQGGVKVTEKIAVVARILHNIGFSRAEIADILNISVSTTWWLLFGDKVLTPAVRAVRIADVEE